MNDIDLRNRVAVITGGARGIGLACAQRFVQSGARVVLWDADAAALDAAQRALGNGVQIDVVELTREQEIEKAANRTYAANESVDILINNAGITGPNHPTWEYSSYDFRRVIEVDLIAPFLVARALTPKMIARGYGRIVNVASIAGKDGTPNASAYSAAKAGLIGFTKSLGKELALTGVICNCVTPAAAETDIFKQMTAEHIAMMKSKITMGRFVKVEEIAALVAWLSSEDCSFTTGGVFDISGGRASY
jgi:2-dehydro-3-deoxy-L-rhamnonate dehydrogenase (NAD+)